MVSAHQRAHLGRQFGVGVLGADHVDAARGVGRGEQFHGGGAQRVGHLVQGGLAGPRPVVLDLAQEGHGQAAALGHHGEGEFEVPAPAPHGGAHPEVLIFVVAHRSGSLLHPSPCRRRAPIGAPSS